MKKIALCVAALATIVAASGCLSNEAQACIKSQECAGEADPAAKCEELQADCDADCQEIKTACAAQNDALAACLVANGTCDEIDGVDGTFFGVEALGEGGACESQGTAAGECAAEAAEGEGEGEEA
jgi:hypothetical protein